jgi:hypothetical protein
MKNFTIPQPCNENFAAMTPTEQGAFCSKCETNTFDFRNKNTEQIKQILRAHVGKHICGQLTFEQEAKLNADFEAYSFKSTKTFQSAFLFSLIATFGLTLFSCNDQRQEAEITNFQETAKSILADAAPAHEKLAFIDQEIVAKQEIEALVKEDFVWISDQQVELQEYNFDEIQITSERIYSYGGAMVYTAAYSDYLVATVDPVEEFDTEGRVIPTEFSSLAFPNPTSNNSTIEIKAPTSGQYQIDLYDMNGKHQTAIYSGSIERGTFQQEIEMSDLPPGMYLVTILSKEYKETVRISKI